jgi:hypothetical protein
VVSSHLPPKVFGMTDDSTPGWEPSKPPRMRSAAQRAMIRRRTEHRPSRPDLQLAWQKQRWFRLCLDRKLMEAAYQGLAVILHVPCDASARARMRATLYKMARASAAHFGTPLCGALYGQMLYASAPTFVKIARTVHGNFFVWR